MRNFKFFLSAIALALAVSAFGQGSTAPYSNAQETYSQLWNLSNVYRNTVTAANLGTQLDSINSGTIYVSTAKWGTGIANSDTFKLAPLPNGTGSLNVWASMLKASVLSNTVVATATFTPQSSPDGTHWANIPGVTVATLTTSSKTVPETTMFSFPITSTTTGGKFGKYFRVKITNTADTLSVWSGFQFFAK
jgi:hypothetical protein